MPRPRTLDAQALLLDPKPFWDAVQRYKGWTDKELHNIVAYSLGEKLLNFDPDRELLCIIYAPAFESKSAKFLKELILRMLAAPGFKQLLPSSYASSPNA